MVDMTCELELALCAQGLDDGVSVGSSVSTDCCSTLWPVLLLVTAILCIGGKQLGKTILAGLCAVPAHLACLLLLRSSILMAVGPA